MHCAAAASPIPLSQFASLSVLTIPSSRIVDSSNSNSTNSSESENEMVEPMIAASPTCSCTSDCAMAAIREVHVHIQSLLLLQSKSNSSNSSSKSGNDDYTSQLLHEEEQLVVSSSSIQIYRPLTTNGMTIYYRFLDGRHTNTSNNNTNTTNKIVQSLILSSSNSNTKSNTTTMDLLPTKVLGVVVCVAVTGPCTLFTASSLSYTMCQRMTDCITQIQQQQQKQASSSSSSSAKISTKELLTHYLLVDDEGRIKNSVIQPSMDYIQLPDYSSNSHGSSTKGGRTSAAMMLLSSPVLGRMTPIAEFGRKAARRASTGIVRGVMNVGTSSTTTTPNAGSSMMNLQQQQQSAVVAVETGFPLSIRSNSGTAARTMMDRLTILSVTEHGTFLKKYEQTGQERKANFDLTGGGGGGGMNTRSRFRRRRTSDTTRDADFDHFDYKGPPATTTTTTATNNSSETTRPQKLASSSITAMNSPVQQQSQQTSTGKLLQFKSSAKDTKRGPGSRRPATTTTPTQGTGASTNGDTMTSQRQPEGTKVIDRIDHLTNNKRIINKLDNDDGTYDSRSQPSSAGGGGGTPYSTTDNGSVMSGRTSSSNNNSTLGKLQINIALNEDLSCSYKLSQLSSCSVDGIVQVQVKTTLPSTNLNGGIPFVLLLKDPMAHIESMNENPKYATKITNNNNNNNSSSFNNDSFNVVIPEQEKYFSLLKYRCKDDLRPVPIRVQAKVKADGTFCRVALQISSNPNNESKLTDLTIAMGVPTDKVYGESLVTQPSGGIYDPAKSSVIWCVSELGCGEKFQLQARFEIKVDANRNAAISSSPSNSSSASSSDLNFPVLVRCQCLHVQLSGVGFEVRNNSGNNNSNNRPQQQLFPPTDIVMKVASRFRLSHREKNS